MRRSYGTSTLLRPRDVRASGGSDRAPAAEPPMPSMVEMIGNTRRHLAPGAVAIALLDAYKQWVSPLLPAACRFTPTCSEYARLAFERHGFWRAAWLTVRRLAKCHPFHPGGLDLP